MTTLLSFVTGYLVWLPCFTCASLLALGVLIMEMSRSNTNYLDPTFGNKGVVNLPFKAIPDVRSALDAAPQFKEKLLLLAYVSRQDSKVSRLNKDGNPDLLFGNKGFVPVPLSGVERFLPVSLSVLTDGRWLVTGLDSDQGIIFTRQLKDGRPDPSFGLNNDGVVRYKVSDFVDQGTYSDARFHGGRLLGGDVDESVHSSSGFKVVSSALDDKIVAVISIYFGGGIFESFVMRLNRNGSLDKTFGGKGFSAIEAPGLKSNSNLSVLAQQDGGAVVSFISGDWCSYLIRFKQDGAFDIGFGGKGTGVVSIPFQGYPNVTSLVLKPDGGIIAGGRALPKSSIVSLTSEGLPDPGFNDGDPLFFNVPGYADTTTLWHIGLQSDGKILAGINVMNDNNESSMGVIARFGLDGKIDEEYGEKGFISLNGMPGQCQFLVVLADDRAVCGFGNHIVRSLA
ncbi:hypothetical protein CP336_00785 [Pseudomonas fluorescens]|nr:hypothetical protein CP336_00785 [Pseudomonas fluorescens]